MKKHAPALYCLLLGALMMTICSTCSFLFATNNWSDANCIFTVGRSMAHGKVLYRDIMDHKGIYIYVINIFGYLLSHRTFLGMYVIEIVFFSVFLYCSYRSFLLYVRPATALCLLPLLATITAACNAFDAGCSAEEFALPMAAASIYYILYYLRSGCDRRRMNRNILLTNGFLAGLVFWIKYTMLGLWFGFMLMVFILMLSEKQIKQAFLACLSFLAGMAAATVPVLLYFGLHGALKDCWNVYFYDNIFLYASFEGNMADRLHTMCRYYLRQCRGNLFVTVSVWGGMFWSVFFMPFDGQKQSRTGTLLRRLTLPVMYLFLLAGIYWGGKNYWYYFLITAAFTATGLIALGMLWEQVSAKRRLPGFPVTPALLTALTGLACVWSWFFCNNAGLRLQKWEDTEQYQFAQVMCQSEHPTLQVYHFLDTGYYNALDIIPTCPYFTITNHPRELIPDLYAAQYDTVLHHRVEYVMCWNSVPTMIENHYYPVSCRQDTGRILLRRSDYRRFTTTYAGMMQGQYVATADSLDWHSIWDGENTILEATLPQTIPGGALKVSLDGVSDTIWDNVPPYDQNAAAEAKNPVPFPVFQAAGPDGVFVTPEISSSLDINGGRFLMLTFPDMPINRIRLLPDSFGSSDWQARIDIMTREPLETPLYTSPIAKALGHDNSAISYLAMDNDMDTGWSTETPQMPDQVFDLILEQPCHDICGVKLALPAHTDGAARALHIYSTPDNENWSMLDAWSANGTDFFFDATESCMIRLITGDIPPGTQQPWAINELYLWRIIPEQ